MNTKGAQTAILAVLIGALALVGLVTLAQIARDADDKHSLQSEVLIRDCDYLGEAQHYSFYNTGRKEPLRRREMVYDCGNGNLYYTP